MKRIDLITEQIAKRMELNGTFGSGQIFVDRNGYAYFRDPDYIMGNLTFKYRKRSKVTRTHQYNGQTIEHTEYHTRLTKTLQVKLRAEIKQRLLDVRFYKESTQFEWERPSWALWAPYSGKRIRRSALKALYEVKND